MHGEKVGRKFRSRLFDAVMGDGSLVPAFQPIIDLKSGKISSFEVLARWNDSELGVVNPSEFIPLIERAGIIDQMTDHLIRSACRRAMDWAGDFRLAFNVSPSQFVAPDLAARIAKAAASSGLPVERLQIEITEGAIFDDSEEVMRNIEALKDLGIRMILDDFGTGFSSLIRLQSIPFNKLKIDGNFVRTMETKRDSRKIVSAVIGLGHSLGMSVVAEGVETDHQLRILLQLGCDYGQGYYFSRPVFAEHVPEILEQRGCAPHEPKPREMSCNRRLAELNALYENDLMAICFIDDSSRVISVNRAFCRLTGIDGATATGSLLSDSFPSNGLLISELIRVLIEGKDPHDMDAIIETANGSYNFKFSPVRDEDGEVIGISLFLPLNSGVGNPELLSRFGASLQSPAGIASRFSEPGVVLHS